jgi:hypothetical protein
MLSLRISAELSDTRSAEMLLANNINTYIKKKFALMNVNLKELL